MALRMLEFSFIRRFKPTLNSNMFDYGITSRKHTQEELNKMSANHPNRIGIRVTDIINNKVDDFLSLRAAAKHLNTRDCSLRRPLASGKLFKGQYRIERIGKT